MDIPLDLVKGSVQEGLIYMFSLDYKDNPKPHFYICLKTTSDVVVFSCCTSQRDNVLKFIEKRRLPYDTLVFISEEGNNPFTKPTYVNCNGIEIVDWETFAGMHSADKVKFRGTIDGDSYQKIINGIKLSPLVDRSIKKLFSSQIKD